MILGIGIDLCKIERIATALDRFGDRFQERILTPWEREFCAQRGDPVRAVALRFAAKEAFSKAVGLGMRGISWREIETRHLPTGQPYLVLYARAEKVARRLGMVASHISLTDEAGMASAVVVIEGSPPAGGSPATEDFS